VFIRSRKLRAVPEMLKSVGPFFNHIDHIDNSDLKETQEKDTRNNLNRDLDLKQIVPAR